MVEPALEMREGRNPADGDPLASVRTVDMETDYYSAHM
jgi:hypothetical protein